ncbi:MotA/TolQ/ExbB proton channel family protein [Verrucomicrobiaceae bacterium 227]
MKFPFLLALLFAFFPSLALAADPGAAVEDITLAEILQKGGWVMIVLVVLSIFTLILVMLYFLTLRRSAVVTNKFMNAAEAMIRKRDYLGLIAYCHRRNEAVARVTQKSLDFLTKNPAASQSEIREVAEAEGSRQAGILTQRISYLADIGGIAPMVGLLGTVIGMIKSFMEIANGNIEGTKQLQLAEGVWEALITTAAGLVISIVAMTFYSFFRGRVQNHIAELEAASTHILALVGGQLNQTQASQHFDDYPGREI